MKHNGCEKPADPAFFNAKREVCISGEIIAYLAVLYYNTVMENQVKMDQLKQGTWLVGVSGGGDSMALLDMCRRAGVNLRCAHVNYHHRETADRDQQICEQYCSKWSIPIDVLHAQTSETGNFQANARKDRYVFYKELCECHNCKGVLVAHQQDDVLETYLMQKQRGSIPQRYGLCRETDIFDVHVVRPLLAYTREELRGYCTRFAVVYGDDESNFTDDYERNRIRHHQLEKMDENMRLSLLQRMEADNERLSVLQKESEAFLKRWKGSCRELLDQKESAFILQYWIRKQSGCSLSMGAQQDLLRRLCSLKTQWQQTLTDHWVLKKEYDQLVVDKLEMCVFAYVYDSPQMLQTPYFTLCDQGERIEGVTLSKDDFPITIRNAAPGDAIKLRFGTKKLHRWFIDRHIPLDQRRSWPVMVNAEGTVIFVPKIGCDIAHFSNNPTLFMIQ